jgi:hypothetical protein
MATLEMVPLRSSLPTGLLTLRNATPAMNPAGRLELLLDDAQSAFPQEATASETGTTPKVPAPAESSSAVEGETTARKGGEAR